MPIFDLPFDAARFGRLFAKTAVLVGSLVLAAALCAGCSGGSEGDRAAVFGDNVITEQQVDDYTAQFRKANSCEDSSQWETYLSGSGLTEDTWREKVIRTLATKILVEQKAEELGITADEKAVEQSIQDLKTTNNIADDTAWQDYLEAKGTTEDELRKSYAFASIEQQVILKDAKIDEKATAESAQAYIDGSLGDRVTRRYSVISFPADQVKEAEAALAELQKLDGSDLEKRFAEMAEEQAKTSPELAQGDLGWDLAYSTEGVLDGDKVIKLQPGSLYPDVATSDACAQIYLCTDRFVFDGKVTYDTISDDALKQAIRTATLASNWSNIADTYLTDLVDSANVQVYSK